MEARLMSHIAVLSGQYHLSISKIHRLLRESYSSYFSTEPISEAQGRVSTMLRPLHQVLGDHVKQSAVIHIDEILHQRNGEAATCWVWLLNGSNTVYQKIRAYCNAETAKSLPGEASLCVIITAQCAIYDWLEPSLHQFCWAYVTRNLQQMADYSGDGFHWYSRMARLRKSLVVWLKKVNMDRHHDIQAGIPIFSNTKPAYGYFLIITMYR
ncbi:hypothetical protein CE143_02920 [Photorhabdus luminescens]|uniref:Transposase IS66 central domain-containing protein n=2 Tax=Photorhabdus akhurstii TaxID=171438 RepID=A0ABX8LSX2_9GAMM|nr:hypothetical protein B0X70_02935 [Photorhabdus akhurstii]UJD74035.1 hypothetical protein CE143_02920 [Photorhabdus luminescens]